ncbi:hypothetical protein D3P04_06235 [Paracoccus onubensis]|uniref:Uncharacterized protein n=1 Tax=Paracoccus onubensis TaxID=1675788 RepID=A0A418T2A4_9RHOB|nr:hypothetical protein D3P04_06235 [Paracoccus onubensis]
MKFGSNLIVVLESRSRVMQKSMPCSWMDELTAVLDPPVAFPCAGLICGRIIICLCRKGGPDTDAGD